MTKFVKMSLAAAVAVAGLSSTAAASDTSYSGKLYVEHYAKTSDASTSTSDGMTTTGFEIDFDVTAKRKISDTLTAVAGIEADSDNADSAKTADSAVGLEEAYFAYANKGAAVKFGRQGIDTPTTDGDDGEGFLATYTTGDITVAGAYFPNNSVVAGSDVTAVAVLGSAGPVNFEAWSVGVATHSTSNTVVVGGEFGGVNAEVRSATTSYDAAGSKDGSTLKAVVSGKASNVSLTGIYFSTDKDGAALVTDPTSANSVELVYLAHDNTMYDTTLVAAVASMPLGDKGTAIVKYGTGDLSTTQSVAATVDVSELVLQYNYKLAKSTTASVRYANYSEEVTGSETEKTHARVDVTYKF